MRYRAKRRRTTKRYSTRKRRFPTRKRTFKRSFKRRRMGIGRVPFSKYVTAETNLPIIAKTLLKSEYKSAPYPAAGSLAAWTTSPTTVAPSQSQYFQPNNLYSPGVLCIATSWTVVPVSGYTKMSNDYNIWQVRHCRLHVEIQSITELAGGTTECGHEVMLVPYSSTQYTIAGASASHNWGELEKMPGIKRGRTYPAGGGGPSCLRMSIDYAPNIIDYVPNYWNFAAMQGTGITPPTRIPAIGLHFLQPNNTNMYYTVTLRFEFKVHWWGAFARLLSVEKPEEKEDPESSYKEVNDVPDISSLSVSAPLPAPKSTSWFG